MKDILRWIQPDEEENEYLVLIRFEKKPSPRYYLNKKELDTIDNKPISEHTAYQTTSKEKAHTLHHLAKHYGADTALLKKEEDKLVIITEDEYTKAMKKENLMNLKHPLT